MRAFSPLPRFLESVAIEEPEDSADKKQHSLVEWPRYRQESEGAAPSKRPWDAAVADEQPDGADCPGGEGAYATHTASLGASRNDPAEL